MKKVLFVGAAIVVLSLGAAVNAQAYKAGDKAEVLWKGTWYPAHVVKVRGDQSYIHYDGYGKKWDEWVGADRIRGGEGKVSAKAGSDTTFRVGDAVQVNWKNAWYPAKVTASGKGKWKIHYDGYDNSWDEWVTADRIQQR